MKVLVVGYGVIGQRHERVLRALGHETAIHSRRPSDHATRYAVLGDALTTFRPAYVVIANETASHRVTLDEIWRSGFAGTILVEKPLFAWSEARDPAAAPGVYVGYNLRFHPLLQRLRDWIRDKAVVAASIHVGHHLATWRPWRDYRESYSSQRDQGGGVLRDLSHELDYALWLFGRWRRVAAIGGASGALGVDADDRWSILLECDACPQVSISLSYLDHAPRRLIAINARSDSAIVDFNVGTFSIGDGKNSERISIEREESYRRQHLAILSGVPEAACTYAEGYETLRLIEAIERAAVERRWIMAPERSAPR